MIGTIRRRSRSLKIANSIERFGWTYPILVDENNLILAGHARFHAAKLLGFQRCP